MKNVRIREKKYIRSPEKKELEDDLNEPIPRINTDSSRTRHCYLYPNFAPFSQLTNLELLDDIMQDDDNNVNEFNGDFYMIWKRYKK
ncbi:hypothetical protein RhiirA5_348965 [Rhizophagus irregularis]|uniref:Uncharacterized protein n=1 Tax=Rhizophagus irregularis TaxID=588596 RepID=A0A2I1EGD8_9GLOM|nr:hypothetical protein RhiirA5_348965 [Rhizophagus irregularis]PKC70618.1 hypothetical protein RhiirA1_414191 [Rhizophagus irregularis]PKY21186.1 hypothetical protein RhiirB3_409187 [Rhizophagus irregularis]